MQRQQKGSAALGWIVAILRERNIPFQITGGLAAIAYGATRPLVDIDLDIPESRFGDILPLVSAYLVRGPLQFRDESWDLLLATLNYEGQEIDLGGAFDAKIFDRNRNTWVTCRADFTTSVEYTVLGLKVPVIKKEALIAYKSILSREVDTIDLKMIGGGTLTL